MHLAGETCKASGAKRVVPLKVSGPFHSKMLQGAGEKLKEELKKVEGEFSVSTFVKKVTGVDNVCERSAVYTGGTLRIRKQAETGVTAAFAWDNWRVKFE